MFLGDGTGFKKGKLNPITFAIISKNITEFINPATKLSVFDLSKIISIPAKMISTGQ